MSCWLFITHKVLSPALHEFYWIVHLYTCRNFERVELDRVKGTLPGHYSPVEAGLKRAESQDRSEALFRLNMLL